jgi:hypothetical protein
MNLLGKMNLIKSKPNIGLDNISGINPITNLVSNQANSNRIIASPQAQAIKKKTTSIQVLQNNIGQTPAQIISQLSSSMPEDNSNKVLISCKLELNDNTNNYLEDTVNKQFQLSADELEELLLFVEQVELKRGKEEKSKQEKRSSAIAKKIYGQAGGDEFLTENAIICSVNDKNQEEEWHQTIFINQSEQNQEAQEICQKLNFYNPQHSWILESWLSQQASSWMVKRYSPNADQILYQVSFGFPDQTFLEAEGPSREGSIVAVAEDLLS